MPLVSAMAGAVFTVGVCWALGTLILHWLQLDFHRLEGSLIAFVTGSGCLSLAVFVLCVIHQARLPIFLVGGSAAVAAAGWIVRKSPGAKSLPAVRLGWKLVFTTIYVAFFLCYLTNALAPEISPDGSSYHLGNVARYWRNHGFDWGYHSIYSSLSQGMEMLYLVAFCIGRHPAAATVHMAFQAALPLLILCYGRRFGFPGVGAFAGLLVYVSPVIGITGSSAYNDLAVATLIFAGFYLLEVYSVILSGKRQLLIGLLCGASFAIKYTAGFMLLFSAGWARGRRLVALCLGAGVMAAPWLLRNWLWLGNPFAPFLNSWFPNPYWTAGAEHEYLSGLRAYPPFQSYWDFFSQLTVLGGLVPGMIGPAFLLIPLALLALRNSHGRRLLLAGVVYSIPALLNTEIRFLIPALPFWALALGLGLELSQGVLPAVALFQSLLCWPNVMDVYCNPNAWRIRGFQICAMLRVEPEAIYIGRHVGDYALKDTIDRNVPGHTRIFSFAGRAAAYLDRDIVVGYESSQGLKIQNALQGAASAGSGERAAALLTKSEGCDFLLVNDSDAVADSMKKKTNVWGLSEVVKANGTTLYRID